jgi:hypothetical protein
MDNEKTKQYFSSIPYNISDPRKSSREYYEKEVVKFGDYNDFPDYLVNLYNNSSIHATCINAIVEAIKGDGLVAEPTWVLDQANSMGDTWNDIFARVAKDYYIFGGFGLEIIYNKLRTKPAEVYHIPFASIRAKEANHRGHCEGYFIAHEWDTKGKYDVDLTKALYMPSFDYKKRNEEPSQLFYYKPYHPLQKYYPLPEYVGALKVVELDCEIDNYHVSNIKNSFSPSIAITTFTNGNDDDRRSIENQLRLQYQGSSQAGQMFYMDVDSIENKPIIEPIPQNSSDGYHVAINDMTVQKILTAHRITSPLLLGIAQPGSLGNKDEMLDAYHLFLNMVIKPYQQDILSVFEKLLELKYPEFDIILGVEQKNILDTGIEEVDVVTSKETETSEGVELETEINEDIASRTMTNTFLISETKLRSFSDINNNVDTELLRNAVRIAQDLEIQRIIGTLLYDSLMTQVDNGVFTDANYETLVK